MRWPLAARTKTMSEELSHREMQTIGEEVVGVLCSIFDPEIPVDIYLNPCIVYILPKPL